MKIKSLPEAIALAVANASAHISNYDLEQLYGQDVIDADEETQDLLTHAQRIVAATIKRLTP